MQRPIQRRGSGRLGVVEGRATDDLFNASAHGLVGGHEGFPGVVVDYDDETVAGHVSGPDGVNPAVG